MIWDTAPLELKELTSVVALKKSIKEWKPNCSCRLCKKGYVTDSLQSHNEPFDILS